MERDLKSDIWAIWKILINCKENFLYSKYLHKPDTKEEAEYLSHSRHFQFLQHSLWRLCVIEINKLLSKSDKDFYNLWTFIKNLENNIYKGHHVPADAIIDWRNTLSSKKSLTKKILLLRNKLYAHTDRDVGKLSVDITFEEVYDLIVIVEKVIRGIYIHSFDSDILTETPIFERGRFDIIKVLAKEKNDRINAIQNWGKSKE
ncbi:MAG: hypothetical protein WKF97_01740 [Chitinophagaceae bacterium]